jgi:preprotein translocase subunit YajC
MEPPRSSLIPLFLVFGIFYFLLLAPMPKRQKGAPDDGHGKKS